MTGHMQVTKCEVLEQDTIQSARLSERRTRNKSDRHLQSSPWCCSATLKRRGRVRAWRPRAGVTLCGRDAQCTVRVHWWRLEIGRHSVHSFWILPP